MNAVILAGGKGTRLKPYSIAIPKPMLPLDDYPILEVIIRQLKIFGVTKVILTLGHLSSFFQSYFKDGSKLDIDIEYCIEKIPLGTAGPLNLVENWDEDILVMNGDILTTLNYNDIISYHKENNYAATIALSNRVVQIDYGVIETHGGGTLKEYKEKPEIRYNVSMGIYILNKIVLDYIPKNKKFDMPDLLLSLKKSGHEIGCFQTNCYWKDMGRFSDYDEATRDFQKDKSKFLMDV